VGILLVKISREGNSHFKKIKNENEGWDVIGVFPKIFPYCIRPSVGIFHLKIQGLI